MTQPDEYAPAPRRRYHFHAPGVVYVVVTIFLALGAFNSQNNLLFWALGLAFGGLIVSGIVSGSALLGISIEREPPLPVRVGDDVVLRYRVRNANRFIPAFALHIEECAGQAGGASATWPRHMGQCRALVLHVGPGERITAAAKAPATARGEAILTSVRIWTTFPFGIARKSVTYELPARALVRPRPIAIDRWPIVHTRGRRGQHAHARPGRDGEFYGLREYRPGDPMRQVAHRASARAGELLVRTTTDLAPRAVWIVVRLRPGDAPDDQERAISIAAGLIDRAGTMGYDVALAVPAGACVCVPRGGARSISRLHDALVRLDTASPAGVDTFPARARHRACIVVHAGGVDPSWAPPGAEHVSGADAVRDSAPAQEAAR